MNRGRELARTVTGGVIVAACFVVIFEGWLVLLAALATIGRA